MAFRVYGYAWDKNIAYSIPFILCFLTKEGDDSCWILTHKDQFVDLEIICIVSSVLKWLKAKSQKPDSVVLCMLLEYGNGSHWYCVLSFRKVVALWIDGDEHVEMSVINSEKWLLARFPFVQVKITWIQVHCKRTLCFTVFAFLTSTIIPFVFV